MVYNKQLDLLEKEVSKEPKMSLKMGMVKLG